MQIRFRLFPNPFSENHYKYTTNAPDMQVKKMERCPKFIK